MARRNRQAAAIGMAPGAAAPPSGAGLPTSLFSLLGAVKQAPMEFMGNPGQELPIKTIGSIPSGLTGVGNMSPQKAVEFWEEQKKGMSAQEIKDLGDPIELKIYDTDLIGKAFGFNPEEIEGILSGDISKLSDEGKVLRGLGSMMAHEGNKLNFKGNWDLTNLVDMRGGPKLDPFGIQTKKEVENSIRVRQSTGPRGMGRDGVQYGPDNLPTQNELDNMVRQAQGMGRDRDPRSANEIRSGIVSGMHNQSQGFGGMHSPGFQQQQAGPATFEEGIWGKRSSLIEQAKGMTAGELMHGTVRRQRKTLKESHADSTLGKVMKGIGLGMATAIGGIMTGGIGAVGGISGILGASAAGGLSGALKSAIMGQGASGWMSGALGGLTGGLAGGGVDVLNAIGGGIKSGAQFTLGSMNQPTPGDLLKAQGGFQSPFDPDKYAHAAELNKSRLENYLLQRSQNPFTSSKQLGAV